MDYKKFGANIRKQRLLLGFTIEQLAEKAGIGENFLGKIERGEGKPSLETSVKISDALGCGVDLFLSGELKYVNQYLENDISFLLERMNINSRKLFLEFVQTNANFFIINNITKE